MWVMLAYQEVHDEGEHERGDASDEEGASEL